MLAQPTADAFLMVQIISSIELGQGNNCQQNHLTGNASNTDSPKIGTIAHSIVHDRANVPCLPKLCYSLGGDEGRELPCRFLSSTCKEIVICKSQEAEQVLKHKQHNLTSHGGLLLGVVTDGCGKLTTCPFP